MANDLRRIGVTVLSLASPSEVLAHCTSVDPMAVIFEFKNTEGHMLELIRSIRHMAPSTRVLVVSPHVSLHAATSALEAGAHDYIVKPVAPLIVISAMGIPAQFPIPSLDQIKWEHIKDTLLETGSISAAARALGIDLRSFRRMVQRYSFHSSEGRNALCEE
jgi:ActR/RegA family two-component response regulator